MALNVSQLLEKVVEIGASDLHLLINTPPVVRLSRQLSVLEGYKEMSLEDIQFFLTQVLTQEQKDLLEINKEVDFSVALGKKARFRVNAFYQKGYPSVAMRTIPMIIPSLDSLNLPPVIGQLCDLRQGFVLVVGPTGHGKSTTIASMIDRVNETRSEHIITIEDPIEYLFTNKKSIVEQREMYLDTHSWDIALKSILRQDPNIVFVGEMRDYETIKAALTIAETGHLVFATLHTNSASQSIDRIIDSFPENQQPLVKLQLSQIIGAVISVRLVKGIDGKLWPAIELMTGADAVTNLIREGKTHMIDNVISTSANLGMVSLEQSLVDLVSNGHVDVNSVLQISSRPDLLRRLLQRRGEEQEKGSN